MAGVKLTFREFDALRHLDILAWELEEEGKARGGWVQIKEMADAMDVSYVRCAQVLAALERYGYAERCKDRAKPRRLLYAVSATGGELLHAPKVAPGA